MRKSDPCRSTEQYDRKPHSTSPPRQVTPPNHTTPLHHTTPPNHSTPSSHSTPPSQDTPPLQVIAHRHTPRPQHSDPTDHNHTSLPALLEGNRIVSHHIIQSHLPEYNPKGQQDVVVQNTHKGRQRILTWWRLSDEELDFAYKIPLNKMNTPLAQRRADSACITAYREKISSPIDGKSRQVISTTLLARGLANPRIFKNGWSDYLKEFPPKAYFRDMVEFWRSERLPSVADELLRDIRDDIILGADRLRSNGRSMKMTEQDLHDLMPDADIFSVAMLTTGEAHPEHSSYAPSAIPLSQYQKQKIENVYRQKIKQEKLEYKRAQRQASGQPMTDDEDDPDKWDFD